MESPLIEGLNFSKATTCRTCELKYTMYIRRVNHFSLKNPATDFLTTCRARLAIFTLATVVIILTLQTTPGVHAAELVAQVVDKAGNPVPDTVILIQNGTPSLPTATAPAPKQSVVDQKNKSFVPHVSVIAPGTLVSFPNSDDTRHHVYSFSDAKTFELKLYRANDAPPVAFEQSGIVTLGCNIHDNMKAYLYVTDNPLYGVSDPEGIVRVPYSNMDSDSGQDLPLLVWHPQLETPLELSAQRASAETNSIRITLPIEWQQPQQGKATNELESLLKRYKR